MLDKVVACSFPFLNNVPQERKSPPSVHEPIHYRLGHNESELVHSNPLKSFAADSAFLAVHAGLALLIGRGIGQGKRVAFCTALGMLLAGLIQVPLLALGLGLVVTSFSIAFNVVRIVGAAYLVWRGIALIRQSRGVGSLLVSNKTTVFAALRDGLVASLSNPKGLIFMLAFLPQFVDQSRSSVVQQMLILGVTMKLIAFVVEGAIAIATGALGRRLARVPRLMMWQNRLTGCVMIALGLRLLIAADTRVGAT
jgi:threonine/homoserine/homoserine lactone efflux protein